jgi:hypothetical protein
MPLVKSTVRVPYIHTPDPARDCFINTFHFGRSDGPTTGNWEDLEGALKNYYTAFNGDTSSSADGMKKYLSNHLDWAGVVIEHFVATPGVAHCGPPVRTHAPNWAATGGAESNASLPLEVAVVSSLYGTIDGATGILSTHPLKNRRGRRYLGPWQTRINSAAGAPDLAPSVSAEACGMISYAEVNLLSDASAAGWTEVIWSQAAQAVTRVSNGWINNDFDTQRRRGIDATLRNPW